MYCFWHLQYGWFYQIFVISRSTEIPIESNFVHSVCMCKITLTESCKSHGSLIRYRERLAAEKWSGKKSRETMAEGKNSFFPLPLTVFFCVKDIPILRSFLPNFIGIFIIFRRKYAQFFANFYLLVHRIVFLANCAESCVILHEEVRKAVDSNRI